MTATSKPISPARACRKSQSERFTCETWAWVVAESSMVPGPRPARWATTLAMSESLTFW